MHVLSNVSTAFLAFIVSSIHHDILNTPLSKSLVTLGGLVGVQDYILNTFEFVEFRIIIIIIIIILLLPLFCFHGFSKTTNRIALKLLVHTNKSNPHPW